MQGIGGVTARGGAATDCAIVKTLDFPVTLSAREHVRDNELEEQLLAYQASQTTALSTFVDSRKH